MPLALDALNGQRTESDSMKIRPTTSLARVSLGIAFVFITSASLAFAQASPAPSPAMPPGTSTTSGTSAAAPSGMPNEAEMMKQMMEMGKLNENHKLLASLDGTWDCKVKFWMNGDSNSKPQESKSTAIRKSVMGGRYFVEDVTGKMPMPGPDGKSKDFDFKGQGTEGYDNAKQKFVSTWMDNMGTGMMVSAGTYDPATKTFTYTAEVSPAPGMKEQVREVVKLTDKDHMTFEYYE